jgi:hypothetical protein
MHTKLHYVYSMYHVMGCAIGVVALWGFDTRDVRLFTGEGHTTT